MMFYVLAFLISFFQSSLISAFFPSILLSPNLLLVYLFLNLLKKEDLVKVFISGFFLDLFQDSLGFNISGFILFSMVLSLLRERYELPNRLSLIIFYFLLSSIEKLWTFFLFRWKYYVQIDPLIILLSYLVEIGFLLLMTKGYTNKQA